MDSTPDRLANDRISTIPNTSGKWKQDDEPICELTFKKPLYFYELVILAKVVHEANTSYDSYLLFKNNCYHYAGTIVAMLQEVKEGVTMSMDGARAEAGLWCGMVISSAAKCLKPEAQISLAEDFKKNVKELVSFVPILS